VTNLANNRSIIVRVNDRGPFARGRLIDVSQSVASILDFKRAGTARVKVDYVGPAQMDGRDQKMLMASYRAPGRGSDVLLALNEQPRPRPVLASATPRKKLRVDRFEIFNEQPEYPDSFEGGAGDDLLAPLILRDGVASSYAAREDLTAPHEAAEALGSQTVLQLGVFGDSANAARVGKDFARYGRVRSTEITSGDRALQIVRVVLDGRTTTPERVLAAAAAAGLHDAFLLGR
jgi:hypothetical protein